MRPIAYYITAHGYGHGARSADILNALQAAAPGQPMIVKTDLPRNFLHSRLGTGFDLRPGAFDVGLIQKDSIQVDMEASIETIESLYAQEHELIEQEADFIRNENVGMVVADIPAIPLAAAQKAGIPNIATGNLGWDWIYADFTRHDSRWETYVEKIRAVYARTDLLLRQPFAEPMAAFPHRIDLPLLATPGRPSKEQISNTTGADPNKPWVLLSFTTLDLDATALKNLAGLTDYELFSVDPLSWPGSTVHCISRATASFADIMASVDLVVTKPGFGIISECIANDKPIIYAERNDFREYAVLVKNIERYCRHAFIPAADLYRGQLSRVLDHVQTAPPAPETMPRGGAARAAAEIFNRLA